MDNIRLRNLHQSSVRSNCQNSEIFLEELCTDIDIRQSIVVAANIKVMNICLNPKPKQN